MNVLVFDIGGTFIKYALMSKEGEILEKDKTPTPLSSQKELFDALFQVYRKYEKDVEGIAISMPGNIDVEKGYIYTPGALTFNAGTYFVDDLKKRIPLENIYIENDGKSAALAEMWLGNLKGCQNGAVMILGTGIGGALIANGKLLKGKHFFAGELSFLMEDPDHVDYQHIFAMNGSTISLVGRYAAMKGLNQKEVTGETIFEAIKNGDETAISCLEHMCKHIAIQIFNTQCFIDPEVVCIGGGVSQQPILLETIQKYLKEIYDKMPFPVPSVQVTTCKFLADANLIGALYNYLLHTKGN